MTDDHELARYCPHCGERIVITFSAQVKTLQATAKPGQRPGVDAVIHTEADSLTLVPLRDAGVLAAFVEANDKYGKRFASEEHGERALLRFFERAKRYFAPTEDLRLLEAEFGNSVEMWAQERLAVVLKDGYVAAFIPMTRISGLPADVQTQSLGAWIRTRWGFVPEANKIAFVTLRQRFLGDFARVLTDTK